MSKTKDIPEQTIAPVDEPKNGKEPSSEIQLEVDISTLTFGDLLDVMDAMETASNPFQLVRLFDRIVVGGIRGYKLTDFNPIMDAIGAAMSSAVISDEVKN